MLLSYIKHLLTATNQHGAHSPFVYDYLTKCLYKKPNYKTSKTVNLLLKSISYFEIESIWIISDKDDTEKQIQQIPDVQINQNPPFDIIYMENPSVVPEFEAEKVHNDTMILMDKIHQNKTYSDSWERLKNSNEFTVSIDAYHCGILFVRKEQVKEHFKIRM